MSKISQWLKSLLGRQTPAPFPASSLTSSQTIKSSAVFVGCARSVEPHLQAVLSNLEIYTTLFSRCAFVFVENDSEDTTKSLLKGWLSGRPRSHLIELDGLATRVSSRTERLAFARNAYITLVEQSEYRNFDYLVALDFDDVNAGAVDVAGFTSAIEWLSNNPYAQAAFPNSLPHYYDIWALRHQTWCPGDCWAEVRSSADLPIQEAQNRYVHERQIYIPGDSPPIPVKSAFGGMGVYRLNATLGARYRGINDDGSEVCEHVSFNSSVATHGILYIYPSWKNHAPLEHLGTTAHAMGASRDLTVEEKGKSCTILAPREHCLDKYRNDHPLYDRRLPLLSDIIARAAPAKTMIDVGANIGDTIALCRLAGCDAEFIAIEPSSRYFAYLETNMKSLPSLFGPTRAIQAFIGIPSDNLTLLENCGTASPTQSSLLPENNSETRQTPTLTFSMLETQSVSLIKTDTDGYDALILSSNIEFIKARRPVLWVEADTNQSDPEHESRWKVILSDLSLTHPYLCVFDNFGFLITHGLTEEKIESTFDLIRYSRRQKFGSPDSVRGPSIYYLDIALFPLDYQSAYVDFVSLLDESST